MKNLKILTALGLLAAAGAAQADVTGTAAIVSDYDFRGITQTLEDPAVQGSIDYAHDSGFYGGVWGSNVDFSSGEDLADPSTEVDVYAGFKGTAGDFGYDAGIVYYAYPGESDFNYPEIYVKGSFSIVSAGIYYSNDFGGTDESSFYVYGDVGVPAGPVTFTLHAGLSDGDGIEALFGEDNYTDYSAGVSYTASNITLGMKWVTVDFDDFSDDRVILSISTALPWGE